MSDAVRNSEFRTINYIKVINMNNNKMNVDGLIRLPKVLELTSLGKSTWWKGVKDGRFPAPVHLTPRTTAWRAVDILHLIDNLSTKGGANV